jgi:hypothetical protein
MMNFKEHEQVADEIIALLAEKSDVSVSDAERILNLAREYIRWSPVRPRIIDDGSSQTQ